MLGRIPRYQHAVLVGGAMVALLAGCSGGKAAGTGALGNGAPSPVAGSPSTAPSPTDTAASPGATSAPTGGSTGGGGGGGGGTTAPASHPYPSDYPGAILSAWANHDSAYLAQLTSSSTAAAIHGYGNINTHWTLIISDGAAGSTYSTYYNSAGDLIILRVSNAAVGGHQWHAGSVQTWDPMTFPASAGAYTKKYVDAWIAGNKARLGLLGTSGMITLLSEKTTPTADYTLGAPFSSDPGSAEVEIKDATTSLDISVIIDTTKLGHQHAIGGCDIGC